eukprot:6762704-Prymnesium_polylepis.1
MNRYSRTTPSPTGLQTSRARRVEAHGRVDLCFPCSCTTRAWTGWRASPTHASRRGCDAARRAW